MTLPVLSVAQSDVDFLNSRKITPSLHGRILIERAVVRRVCEALIAAGYFITIDNGEDEPVKDSQDVEAIMRESQATDEEHFYVSTEPVVGRRGRKFFGYVYFVYGNDGWDVVNDYTTNLEPVLAPVNKWCDTLNDGAFFTLPSEREAQLAAALTALVAWVDATGVEKNPALAGMNIQPLLDARDLIGAPRVPRGWDKVEGGLEPGQLNPQALAAAQQFSAGTAGAKLEG